MADLEELREFFRHKLREAGKQILLSKVVPMIRDEFDERFDVRDHGYTRLVPFLEHEFDEFAYVSRENGSGAETICLLESEEEDSSNSQHSDSERCSFGSEHEADSATSIEDLESDEQAAVDAVMRYLETQGAGGARLSDIGQHLAHVGAHVSPHKRVPGLLKRLLAGQDHLFSVSEDDVVTLANDSSSASSVSVEASAAALISLRTQLEHVTRERDDAVRRVRSSESRHDESARVWASERAALAGQLSELKTRVEELQREVQRGEERNAEIHVKYGRLMAEHVAVNRSLDELKSKHEQNDGVLANLDRSSRAELVQAKKYFGDGYKKIQAELDTREQCVICWESSRQIVFMPCLHMVCCSTCSVPLATCPTCRAHVDARLQPFHS